MIDFCLQRWSKTDAPRLHRDAEGVLGQAGNAARVALNS